MRDATLSVGSALLLLFTTCAAQFPPGPGPPGGPFPPRPPGPFPPRPPGPVGPFPPFPPGPVGPFPRPPVSPPFPPPVGPFPRPPPFPGPIPVGSLCAAARCPSSRACRVVQSGGIGPGGRPQSYCLRCVPTGVDNVCNRNRYFYAVLVGNPNFPELLRARTCNPNQPNAPPNCPFGSVCVREGFSNRGQCCFGRPDPPRSGPVFNTDPICGDFPCGGCEPGYVCRKQPINCVTFPCPPFVYECVPLEKDGSCFPRPLFVPPWCFLRPRPVDRCRQDFDCPGFQKCCPDGVRHPPMYYFFDPSD